MRQSESTNTDKSETRGVRRGLLIPDNRWAWYDWVVWPEIGVTWLRRDTREAFASHSYWSLLDHSGVAILGTYFGPSSSNRPTKMCYWLLDKLCHVQTSFCIRILIQIVIRSNQPKFRRNFCMMQYKIEMCTNLKLTEETEMGLLNKMILFWRDIPKRCDIKLFEIPHLKKANSSSI